MSTMEEAVIGELVDRTAARSVLDFACGTGRIAEIVVSALPEALVARRSLGVTPHSDERAYELPLSCATRIERFNARVLSSHHAFGTITVWFLRKPAPRG